MQVELTSELAMIKNLQILFVFANILFIFVGVVEWYMSNIPDDINELTKNPKKNGLKVKMIALRYKVDVHNELEMLPPSSYNSIFKRASNRAYKDFDKFITKTVTDDNEKMLANAYRKEFDIFTTQFSGRNLSGESASKLITDLTNSYNKLVTNINIISVSSLAKDEVDNNTIYKFILKRYIDQITNFIYLFANKQDSTR